MAETITIRTAAATDVISLVTAGPQGVQGPIGPQGPAGAGGGLPEGFDIEAISNTRIRLKYTGTDDIERSVALTIS